MNRNVAKNFLAAQGMRWRSVLFQNPFWQLSIERVYFLLRWWGIRLKSFPVRVDWIWIVYAFVCLNLHVAGRCKGCPRVEQRWTNRQVLLVRWNSVRGIVVRRWVVNWSGSVDESVPAGDVWLLLWNLTVGARRGEGGMGVVVTCDAGVRPPQCRRRTDVTNMSFPLLVPSPCGPQHRQCPRYSRTKRSRLPRTGTGWKRPVFESQWLMSPRRDRGTGANLFINSIAHRA